MARVTAKEVAAAVGVSVATVSNAYNRPDQLSADLRARILVTAGRLGYAGPDAAARTLRRGRSGAVGVLLTERLSYAFSDPYAIGFLAGLAEVVERSGTSIVLMPLRDIDGEPEITAVRQAAIDAMTTLCLPDDHPARVLAKARGIRLVGTTLSTDPGETWVAIDDEAAGRTVGAHLAGLGHRRIVVVADINAPAGQPARQLPMEAIGCIDCAARLRGLNTVLPGGLTVVSAGHNAPASGVSAARWILGQEWRPGDPGAPTAVVGLSDVIALGVLETLRGHGIAVPGQLSVCGFDDIAAAAPAGLTTLRQPIGEKGRLVGDLLLDPQPAPRQVLLPGALVARASSGPVTG